jgi:hypothetical protein
MQAAVTPAASLGHLGRHLQFCVAGFVGE